MLFLTETWLKPALLDSMIEPEGYNVLRSDRVMSKGGGVLLFYKSHLKIENLNFVVTNLNTPGFEFLCVDLSVCAFIFRFLCFYVPPISSSSNNIMNLICQTIDKYVINTRPCYVIGDFNLPHIN